MKEEKRKKAKKKKDAQVSLGGADGDDNANLKVPGKSLKERRKKKKSD